MSGKAPDALVIGAGVVGICVALYLQRTGRSVTIIERSRPGDAASGHNAGAFSVGDCLPIAMPGVVRSIPRMLADPLSPFAISWPYLPRVSPWLVRFLLAGRRVAVERISSAIAALMEAALPAYRPLLARSDAENWIRPGGLLYGFERDESFARARFGVTLRARHGTAFQIMDGDDIAELDPLLAGRFRRGIYLPQAHYTADPGEFTRALARSFTDAGGHIEPATVTGLEQRRGTVRNVVTTAGRHRADIVVLAAGAWSRRLARDLGVRVPLETERGYGVQVPKPGFMLRFPVISGDYHIALSPASPGVRIAGTIELAGLRAPANSERAQRISTAAQRIFPEILLDDSQWWMHFRPSMPDSLPVIGRAPRSDNAFLAFGHGHKGLAQAAITGRLIQELVDDTPPCLDLAPFSPTRFTLAHRVPAHPSQRRRA